MPVEWACWNVQRSLMVYESLQTLGSAGDPFVLLSFVLVYYFYCLLAIAQGAWAQQRMLGPRTSEHKITHRLDALPQFSGTRLR